MGCIGGLIIIYSKPYSIYLRGTELNKVLGANADPRSHKATEMRGRDFKKTTTGLG